MSDLIDIKNKIPYVLNMESLQNRVFIYVHAGYVVDRLGSRLSFSEVLKGKLDQNRLGEYQQGVEQFISEMQAIFVALDYDLKV